MNTNEIVKAWRICANDRTCDNCPCDSQTENDFSSECLDENMRQAADEIDRLQKELDAAVKCIDDTETYLEMGSGKYAYGVIRKWRGRESEVK